MRLPCDAEAVEGDRAIGEPATEEEIAPLGLHLLLVDDNRDVAHSTAVLLRAAGCSVDLAYDGEEAIRAVQSLHPDVVLLDLGLPKMDGYQVAEAIRADRANASTLIIALSGYGQDEHRLRSKRAGFDYHIVKPIEPTALTGLLASLWSCREVEVPAADTSDVPLALRESAS